jgi:putative ABC transport system ATP-binding protein
MDVLNSPALEAHDLYRFYHAGEDETLALRGVSLAVQRGEVVAIIGPSGSGKSTLLNCLAGLDEPDGGWVSVSGERLTRRPESFRARVRARQIGILMQSGNLFHHLTLEQNLVAAQALGAVHRIDRVRNEIESVGLANRAHSFPYQLSGGELARGGLALALVNDPAILLADEPTGEVDSANEEIVLELLRQRASTGRAVVVVTHSADIAAAANRVLRLVDGQLVHD